MPELPEVETIVNDLRIKILDLRIKNLEVLLPRIVKNSLASFKKKIIGNKFVDIERIGKLIVITLERGGYLLAHLKMTGQLIYFSHPTSPPVPLLRKERGTKSSKQIIIAGGHNDGAKPEEMPNKWTRVIFTFSDRSKLYFNDLRTFGYLRIVNSKELEIVKSKFGVEPLGIELTLNLFKEKIKFRKTSIKALLLNQQIIAGLGNIYTDEILFAAKVRPTRAANSLTAKEIKSIYKAIRPILKKAIRARGTTFNNFVDGNGNIGNFVSQLKVYGRNGKKCKKCASIIKKLKVAGRGTHYCPDCQK
ncbi:bifunctional DNA-formamidopyrimidine glycosylase/DNA-(apurinic or apyrimidinic site) lyase [Candidatus Parcubacteria bacterium]|nr:bifunctional DNA-formamidopyrimidine glycosylase/DNA-(apurinic or apyrimidinic site) lyase [Candidatus Parcubacteria bacterium]